MADGGAGSNVDAKLKAQRDELERRKEALLAKRSALSAKSQGGGPSSASSSSSAAAAGSAPKPAVPSRAPPVPSRVAPTAAAKQGESGDDVSKTSAGKAQASSVKANVEAKEVQDDVQEVSFSLANFSIKGLFGGTSAAAPEAPAQPKEDEAAIAAATNAQRVEEERIAAEKAAAEKLAEEERVAAEAKKLEEERIASEKKKVEEERIAAEKAAAEQKAEEERIAAAEKKAEREHVAAAEQKKKAEEEKIAASASLASSEAREMSEENQNREWQEERRVMEAKLGDALKAQANAERELASVRKELERESKALADKDAFTEEMGDELVRSRHELDMHLEENEKLRRERDAALLDLEKMADEKKGLADAASFRTEGDATQVLSLKAALSESQAQCLLKSDEAASLASKIETLRSEVQAVKAQSSHALEEAERRRKEADEKLQAQVAVHAEGLRLAKEAEAGKVRDKDESLRRLQRELELAKEESRKGKGEEGIAQGLRIQIEELEGALEIARLDLEISAEEKEEAVHAMQVAREREQAVEDEMAARDAQCARLEAVNAGLLQRAADLEARLGGKAMREGSTRESQVMADASSAQAVSVEGCRGCEALREESRASSKRSSSLLKMLTSAREELLIAKMMLLLQPVDIGPLASETQDANGKLASCAASIVGFGGLLMLTHSMLSVSAGEDGAMGGRGQDEIAGEEEGQEGRMATRAQVSKTLGAWERIMAAAWDGSRKVVESMTRFQGEMQEARKVLLDVCGRGMGGMGQEELELVRECVGFVDRVSQMVRSVLSEDEWSHLSLAPKLANLLGFMSCQGQGQEECGSVLPCGLREKRLELEEEARVQASIKEQLEMKKRELRDIGVLLRDKEDELLALSLRVQMSREAPNAPSNAQAQLSALRSEYETYKKEAEEALEKYAEAEEQRGQRESARSARQGGGGGHRGIAGGDRGHGEALHDAISRMRPAVVNARALRLREEVMRDLPFLPMPPPSPGRSSGIYSKAQRHIDEVDTRLALAMASPKIVSLAAVGETGQASGRGLAKHAQLRLGLGALNGLQREVEGLKVGIVAAAAAT